jgi:hypothetical protein
MSKLALSNTILLFIDILNTILLIQNIKFYSTYTIIVYL